MLCRLGELGTGTLSLAVVEDLCYRVVVARQGSAGSWSGGFAGDVDARDDASDTQIARGAEYQFVPYRI
jgi:hypothetical protein